MRRFDSLKLFYVFYSHKLRKRNNNWILEMNVFMNQVYNLIKNIKIFLYVTLKKYLNKYEFPNKHLSSMQ